MFQRGGMGIYAVFPERHAALCSESEKDDFIIGDVFALRENEDTYNVGWHFNKRFEGKGFACEAATGLLDYLFGRRAHGVSMDLWKMTISVPNAYANVLVCAAKDVSKSL